MVELAARSLNCKLQGSSRAERNVLGLVVQVQGQPQGTSYKDPQGESTVCWALPLTVPGVTDLELTPTAHQCTSMAAQVPILETRKPRHRQKVIELGQIWELASKSGFISKTEKVEGQGYCTLARDHMGAQTESSRIR